MRENDQNGWVGSVKTIGLSELFPYMTSNGTYVNGSLPQVCYLLSFCEYTLFSFFSLA